MINRWAGETRPPAPSKGKSMAECDDPVVEVHGLSHSYGDCTALHDISLSFVNERTAILGPNGAGKTTLLRVMATALKPQRGEIRLFGESIRHRRGQRRARSRLGYVPQAFTWPGRVTAREFVTYFAWLRGLDHKSRSSAVAAALSRCDLEDVADKRLSELSSGMLRRVSIAQAIVHNPELLILDEPTTSLDPRQRLELRNYIRAIAGGKTVVVSTHLLEDAAHACERILILNRGAVVFDGTADELAAREAPGVPGDTALERGFSAVLLASEVSH